MTNYKPIKSTHFKGLVAKLMPIKSTRFKGLETSITRREKKAGRKTTCHIFIWFIKSTRFNGLETS